MAVGQLRQRRLLRRAALRYAHRGWPVLPGAFLIGDRYACGPLCPSTACHPAVHHWEKVTSSDLSDVKHWWAEAPFSILLATGHEIDVIEIPAWLGNSAFRQVGNTIRSVRTNTHTGRTGARPGTTGAATTPGPVAETPAGQWLVLVTAGPPLLPELASRVDVVRHARGSWTLLPPTRTPGGPVRWMVPPTATGWHLPDSHAIQAALVTALAEPGATFTTDRLAA